MWPADRTLTRPALGGHQSVRERFLVLHYDLNAPVSRTLCLIVKLGLTINLYLFFVYLFACLFVVCL